MTMETGDCGLWKQLAASVLLYVEEILERETGLWFCVASKS